MTTISSDWPTDQSVQLPRKNRCGYGCLARREAAQPRALTRHQARRGCSSGGLCDTTLMSVDLVQATNKGTQSLGTGSLMTASRRSANKIRRPHSPQRLNIGAEARAAARQAGGKDE